MEINRGPTFPLTYVASPFGTIVFANYCPWCGLDLKGVSLPHMHSPDEIRQARVARHRAILRLTRWLLSS